MNNDTTAQYYARTNLFFLIGLWLHLPIALLTAKLAGSSLTFAGLVSLLILSAPTWLVSFHRTRLETSIALACALVSFSALMIHSSGGMTELHFHIFSSLGLCIVLAQPLAIIAAVLVVAVHHVLFFFLLPASLINYDAGIHILIIHAVFAIATGIPAAYVAHNLKIYTVSVRSIASHVSSISSSIAEASDRITAASQTLAHSSEEEAHVLTQTNASVSRLVSLAESNRTQSTAALGSYQSSQQKSERCRSSIDAVRKAIERMEESQKDMEGAISESNARLMDIVNIMSAISEKTSVINDIVFQTRLLSFNASVEAARAGEHGRGFAIVAQEVGNLAQMSGRSLLDIRQLLEESLGKVQSIVLETKDHVAGLILNSTHRVTEGLQLAKECQTFLDELDRDLSLVAEAAQVISRTSHQQADDVRGICEATLQVEDVSKRNSEMAKSASLVAQNLKDASSELSASLEELHQSLGLDQKAA